MPEPLLIDDRAAVRILTMNRPEKLNALNQALSQALYDALVAAERDPAIAAVVLTVPDGRFAPAPTFPSSRPDPEDPRAVAARADLTVNLHLAFSKLSKPVLAAVRGYAMGGGCGLALACDLVIAGTSATFGYPEIKRGIVGAVVVPTWCVRSAARPRSSCWRWASRSASTARSRSA